MRMRPDRVAEQLEGLGPAERAHVNDVGGASGCEVIGHRADGIQAERVLRLDDLPVVVGPGVPIGLGGVIRVMQRRA